MASITNPVQMTEQATLHMKSREFRKAIALLKPHAHDSQQNLKIFAILANAYIKIKEPLAAIALLKPLQDSGRGDTVTAATLGNAYINAGKPDGAIALLKPLQDSGRGDTVTANTLGNAYAVAKNREALEVIAPSITPESLRDYLRAKCAWLNHNTGEAVRITRPYVVKAGALSDIPGGILSIFMACHDEDSPIYAQIRAATGAGKFTSLEQSTKLWKKNPCRAEMAWLRMASNQSLFDLGAIPVSRADRVKAGVDSWVPSYGYKS